MAVPVSCSLPRACLPARPPDLGLCRQDHLLAPRGQFLERGGPANAPPEPPTLPVVREGNRLVDGPHPAVEFTAPCPGSPPDTHLRQPGPGLIRLVLRLEGDAVVARKRLTVIDVHLTD